MGTGGWKEPGGLGKHKHEPAVCPAGEMANSTLGVIHRDKARTLRGRTIPLCSALLSSHLYTPSYGIPEEVSWGLWHFSCEDSESKGPGFLSLEEKWLQVEINAACWYLCVVYQQDRVTFVVVHSGEMRDSQHREKQYFVRKLFFTLKTAKELLKQLREAVLSPSLEIFKVQDVSILEDFPRFKISSFQDFQGSRLKPWTTLSSSPSILSFCGFRVNENQLKWISRFSN